MNRMLVNHQQLVFIFNQDKRVEQRAEYFHRFPDCTQDCVNLFCTFFHHSRSCILTAGSRNIDFLCRSWRDIPVNRFRFGGRRKSRRTGRERPADCHRFIRRRQRTAHDRSRLDRNFHHPVRSFFLLGAESHLNRMLKSILFFQCHQHRTEYSFINPGFIPESHFQLIRVYIDVHCFIWNGDIQCTDREFSNHHPFPAGRFQCLVQDFIMHDTAVDEEHFLIPVSSSVLSDADIPLDDQSVPVIIHFFHKLHGIASVNRLQCRGCLSVSG